MAQTRRHGSATTSHRLEETGDGHWSRDCLAGGVVGLVGLIRLISLASLVFAGRLAGWLPAGLLLMLLGAVPMLLIAAWRGSYRAAVVPPQDAPCVVLALIGTGLIAGMGRAAGFHTTITAIALAGALSGLLLWLLGRCRGGAVVRWIPLPVVIGFMVAIGALMLVGALTLGAGTAIDWRDLRPLLDPAALARWGSAVLFGLVLLMLGRRFQRWWAMPLGLVSGALLFVAVVLAADIELATLRRGGWLLGPFEDAERRFPLPWTSFAEASWSSIAQHAWTLLLVPAACIAAMLVNTSAMQRLAEDDGAQLDFDRELRATGLANAAAAPCGCVPGFASLSLTRLGHRLGGRGRLVGVTVALLTGGALVLGTDWLAWLPRPIVAGLLVCIACDMLLTQVWDRRGDWLRRRYGFGLLLLVAIAVTTVLIGIALGWWTWREVSAVAVPY